MANRIIITRIFIGLNGIVLAALLYFLYSGFYHWEAHSVWLNPTEHSFEIRHDFRLVVCLAVVLPLLILAIGRQRAWLLQATVILAVIPFWQQDIFQRTLFINQPCSAAKLIPLGDRFVQEAESRIMADVRQIDSMVGHANAAGTLAAGVDARSGYFRQGAGLVAPNAVYDIDAVFLKGSHAGQLRLRPKNLHSDHFQGIVDISYYPDGDAAAQFAATSMAKLYPWGTHLFEVCERRYYLIGSKWILAIEGGCFG